MDRHDLDSCQFVNLKKKNRIKVEAGNVGNAEPEAVGRIVNQDDGPGVGMVKTRMNHLGASKKLPELDQSRLGPGSPLPNSQDAGETSAKRFFQNRGG